MAASVVGGVAGFSLGDGDCLVSDEFSGGGLTDIWQVGESSGSVVSSIESGGQVRFSAAANNDDSFDVAFVLSSGWYMDMTSDWAISGWWYSNPPTPDWGDTGIALGVMLDAYPSDAYLKYGATVSIGRHNVDGENFRYEVCNTWWNNEYSEVDQDYNYTDISGTLYVWYDESDDTLKFGDELYGGDPFTVTSFQSGSPSHSQQAWIGFGAYSAGLVPAYNSSRYRGDNFCILDGDVVGPDVGACCFADSCVETIAFSCDGEWQGVQTDCDDCYVPPTGACCIDESCSVTTEAECSGDWLGEDTDCNESPCAADSCYGDVDGSGDVSVGDISALMDYWDDAGGSGDIDGNGVVDVHDLLDLLYHWGDCPE
jgi:hypothetical protein